RSPLSLFAITTAMAILLVVVLIAIAALSRRDDMQRRDVAATAEPGVVNLTRNLAEDVHPTYSPDGTMIAFASNRAGKRDIYVMRVGSAEAPRRLTLHPGNDERPVWSPDGARIAFISDRSGQYDIYIINADGTDERRITTAPVDEGNPAWSPDGRFLAFSRHHPAPPEPFAVDVATG